MEKQNLLKSLSFKIQAYPVTASTKNIESQEI